MCVSYDLYACVWVSIYLCCIHVCMYVLCKYACIVCVGACNVWVCVHVFIFVYACVGMCIYIICMYVYTRIYLLMCGYTCMYYASMCVCVYVFVNQRVGLIACCSNVDSFVWSEPVTEKQNPIRIRVHCGPDTLAIRKPTHGIIRRSLPVRVVKTRRWFSFKITSFHVSVCSYVISLFTIISRRLYVTCTILYDCLIYFTSMITWITS